MWGDLLFLPPHCLACLGEDQDNSLGGLLGEFGTGAWKPCLTTSSNSKTVFLVNYCIVVFQVKHNMYFVKAFLFSYLYY